MPEAARNGAFEALRAEAFALLAEGARDPGSVWRNVTLATIGADGAPSQRTVVLRGFDPATRSLLVHTDDRAGKVRELAADPRCALHGWDAARRIQLRLSARATLARDAALIAAEWSRVRPTVRLGYAVGPAPGTAVERLPEPAAALGHGAANFAVLVLAFDVLEWLRLAPEGHRRARLDWRGGDCAATWLVP